ncbi:MAG: alanine dehydrogenase [Candidatus Binatia bacterium]
MRIGVPTEVMEAEHRVALAPSGARELTHLGHDVWIQSGAGAGSSFTDEAYERAGALVVTDAAEAWAADLVCKVKEPLGEEYGYLRSDLVLFTYLHLAAHEELTRRVLDSGCTAIGYETVQTEDGRLPLLAPMSEIAGRMAPHVGAHYLEAEHGAGILLGGVAGVRPARVVVLGAGVAGRNAAFIAAGMEAEVLLLDRNLDRLREVDEIHRGRIMTLFSSRESVETAVLESDVIVGAVLVPGARAPLLVRRELVAQMQEGAVIMDVAVDQGGCVETIRPTSHSAPIYREHGVIHYGVPNMPGAVPRTSTLALSNATFPYLMELAQRGVDAALAANRPLGLGVNCYRGKVTQKGVAAALGVPPVVAPWLGP